VTRLSKADRQKHVERLLGTSGKSYEEIAAELGVDKKTIYRDAKEMKAAGKVLKKQIPQSQQMRDEVFDRAVSTHDMIQWAARDAQEMLIMLRTEIEGGGEACDACGRKRKDLSDMKTQNYFRGMDTLVKQLELLAKLLGQISDTPQLAIFQIDADVQLILQAIAKFDEGIARQLYSEMLQVSERRRRRLPEFAEIVEGEFQELPMLGAGQ
jgi:predicted transcriptional regulator